MKRTLYLKFLLGYLIFGILGFIVVSTFTTYTTYHYLERETAAGLYQEAQVIAANYGTNYYNQTVSLDDVYTQLQTIDTYLSASIWIINSQGDVLLNSRGDNTAAPISHIEGFNVASFGTSFYQVGNFYGHFAQEQLSVFASITTNYKVRGYVLIHKPVKEIVVLGDGFINIAYLSMAIIFLCTLVLLATYTFTVYLPIRKLTKVADSFTENNFDAKVDIHSNDEMGYLAAAFTYMASELNTLEDDQRKFIANVSHDFRSPLTSIKGYVEAIMDGTIPHEMQDRYLNIILVETERLNKLTQSMLELNKYGSHGTMLDLNSFDINKTIKMTIQSFEGTCKQKKISFELILTGQELFITADISKIQQVIYNLIDNAIKFSHTDSVITIETTARNDKVFVSIKDTGIGIPTASQKKIWERFYKTDSSRGKDKKGTGLGLAIVREIILAHNENINVISTEDVGTEFIFTLPLSKQ